MCIRDSRYVGMVAALALRWRLCSHDGFPGSCPARTFRLLIGDLKVFVPYAELLYSSMPQLPVLETGAELSYTQSACRPSAPSRHSKLLNAIIARVLPSRQWRSPTSMLTIRPIAGTPCGPPAQYAFYLHLIVPVRAMQNNTSVCILLQLA